jgi:hypothetical protein
MGRRLRAAVWTPNLEIQTPPDWSPGAFRHASRGLDYGDRGAPLPDVFGGDPLVPVIFSRLLVRGPEVGPETDRLRRRGAASYHDAERSGGRHQR